MPISTLAVVPALGKSVSHLRLVVQTVAINGALSDPGSPTVNSDNVANLVTSSGSGGYPGSLTFSVGVLDEMELTGTKVSENIRSVNQVRSNHVPVAMAYSGTISEILQPGSQLLARLWFNAASKIVRLEFGARRSLYRIYMVMTDYTESYQMGKNVGRLTVRQANAFNSNAANGHTDTAPVNIYGTTDR